MYAGLQVVDASDFLKSYMEKNLGTSGREQLVAANVLLPILEGENAGFNRKVKMDIPGVAEDATVRTIGIYGDELAPDDPIREYGETHQFDQGLIRGRMPRIPGGIPAPDGYRMEASKAKYPDFFDGVKEGNVPAYLY